MTNSIDASVRAHRAARPAAILIASLLSGGSALADVQPHAGMLRYPDVSKSHIVFSYANDLWLVPREGGVAQKLTTPPGQETFARFSADGTTIAFVGNYEGNRDLYTIPIDGGVAQRVTHHPSTEVLCDWTPDNRLLFFMNGLAGLMRQTQLFTISPAGGPYDPIPVPYGANGAVSPDGNWIAYTPHSIDNRTWKRYRGGMATDIWLFNLKDKTSKKITDWEGTDSQPMWFGGKVYYLSDESSGDGKEHKLNIWVYDTATSARTQVTRFTDFDVKWPAIGPGPAGGGEIVFQNGSQLFLLDLASRSQVPVKVTIPGDRPLVRPRNVNAADYVTGWDISPNAKRVIAEGRGDLWSVPAEKGSARNLTRTSGVFERDASWSPDGRWIAYFADNSGEYELYVTQSDGLGETKCLTKDLDLPKVFRYGPTWSPDSKKIVFTDKAGVIYLLTLAVEGDKPEPAKVTVIDRDPWDNIQGVSWSHDSRWMTYSLQEDHGPHQAVWIYKVDTGEKKKVTNPIFNSFNPVFDKKGEYLFFVSQRSFSPSYSDVDSSFIYDKAQVILAVPLRADLVSPYAPKSDEEDWKASQKKDEKKDEKKDGDKKDDAKKDEAPKDGGDKKDEPGDKKEDAAKAPAKDDGLSGVWEGKVSGPPPLPPGGMPLTLNLKLAEDGKNVSGSIVTPMFTGALKSGSWDAASKSLTIVVTGPGGADATMTLTVAGETMTGTVAAENMVFSVEVKRTKVGAEAAGEKGAKPAEAKMEVTIDFDGFEARAIQLAIRNGNFGQIAVNDSNQLIYVRFGSAGGDDDGPGPGGIKLFDLADDKKEEKTVAGGASSFRITPDGKKLLIVRGNSASIQNASAGATATNVPTSGMNTLLEPREEWKQIFADAWRIERDFFYDPNMHGVNWPLMRERYSAMLPDCSSREDVGYVISEMISELNIGHAYYSGGDIQPSVPDVGVGMLGCDFELVKAGDASAYRVGKIYQGAPWDSDARGPLSQPGVKVKEGDWILAVNNTPVDTAQDPWAAFVGLGGRTVTLTVADGDVALTPAMVKAPYGLDEAEKVAKELEEKQKKDKKEGEDPKPVVPKVRTVVVQTMGSEADLRYRSWIETKRKYVEEKSGGKIGYVYVPDTGVNGQNNLVRQYFGQIGKDGLIVDERWNGGGQIPTRFIEMLNRPITNYWARRDGNDWAWPPDAQQGPKAMLINGLAGSGGDAFPWYFRQSKLGKLIGMRTWGGLVGISGNPGLIDGASVTAPTFGFYEKDGTWGVEGHGVDPDIVVIDDPAKMQNGGDPQLDAAIAQVAGEIETNPYKPTPKPKYPDRSGMGITPEDK